MALQNIMDVGNRHGNEKAVGEWETIMDMEVVAGWEIDVGMGNHGGDGKSSWEWEIEVGVGKSSWEWEIKAGVGKSS